MKPLRIVYRESETFDFPGQITLRVLLSGTQTDGSLAVFEDIVEPGVGPGRHIHRDQDETFFVEAGLFDLEADGTRLRGLGPGDMAFVPRGTVHAFRNIGGVAGAPALRLLARRDSRGDVSPLSRGIFVRRSPDGRDGADRAGSRPGLRRAAT